MEQSFRTAIAMYEKAAATFARRAGVSPLAFQMADAPDWATAAEQLALAGERLTEGVSLSPLQSVLGHLYGQSNLGYYTPATARMDAALPQTETPTNLGQRTKQLWDTFQQDVTWIEQAGSSLRVLEANYLALLQRYCWAMPAPAIKDQAPDVSLYDYARVSAGLAVCMGRKKDNSAPALLVGGDLSGVQDWLYALSSKGVAKGLRGRSFYLQHLAEVIAHYILNRLDLPSCNLLYAGGGNFYLLAPSGSEAELATIQQEISRKLLRLHEGALYVALGHAPLSEAMLAGQRGDVGEAWEAVNRAMNRVKARRFSELDNADMARAIGTPLLGSAEPLDTCAICQRTIAPEEKTQDLEDSRKCGLCVSFEELGNQLRTAEFLVMSRIKIKENSGAVNISDWQRGLAQFGYDVQLLDGAESVKEGWQPQSTDMVTINYWQAEPDIREFPGQPSAAQTVWAFRPLAQCTPIKDNEIATFDKLESDGINRWGVLRMDVDNLGKIFQDGIPGGGLSRVVGLSGMLRLYFEGHVPSLARAYNRDSQGNERPRMYLMYAGGDDLFIVGGWSNLPDLADDIRRDFGLFACGNPHCTISGGISIALDANYPLYQAARQAGDAEHQAKHEGGDAKNALSFLGEVMSWDEEYDRVRSRVDDLRRWLGEGEGKLPRSFLMTLRAIDGEWREWKKQENGQKAEKMGIQPKYAHTDKTLYLGPWQWHMVYNLTRAAERSKNEQIKKEVKAFTGTIIDSEIVSIGVTARWAELLTRGG